MKRFLSIGVVLLVVLGVVALAYMRSAEFRTEDSTVVDDVASFLVLLLLLVFIAVALDFVGDSFLHVTREKQRLEVLEPDSVAADADIKTAQSEIAERQEMPGLWERRARELGAAYDGEYKAEVSRLISKPSPRAPILGEEGRAPHEH